MSGKRDSMAYRLSVTSRVLAGVVGGYALTSLVNIALPLLLGLAGVSCAQALYAVTMASFLLYAAIIMAVFHASSATRAWMWIAGAIVPIGGIAWLLFPGRAL